MSRYWLQVIDRQTGGEVVIGWYPGDRVEVDLAGELTERVKAKGVGLFRSEAHVLADLRLAFGEMLYDLKRRV
jgi:hypothetical protein